MLFNRRAYVSPVHGVYFLRETPLCGRGFAVQQLQNRHNCESTENQTPPKENASRNRKHAKHQVDRRGPLGRW
jgi:hypothetical protein